MARSTPALNPLNPLNTEIADIGGGYAAEANDANFVPENWPPGRLGGAVRLVIPYVLAPSLELLYGILSFSGVLQFPRLNRQTIPDFWSRVYHNPFGVQFRVNSDGLTQGVQVGVGLTLLGCTVNVSAWVFMGADLLHVDASVKIATTAVRVGVNVAKPSYIVRHTKNNAQNIGFNEGYTLGRASVMISVKSLQEQLTATQDALAKKKKRARRR